MKPSLFLFLLLIFSHSLSAQDTGYLKFEFNADSAYLLSNNDFSNIQVIYPGDSVLFKSGIQNIELSVPFDRPYRIFTSVQAGITKVLSYTFSETPALSFEILSGNPAARIYYDSNVMVLTDYDLEIYYKGQYFGTGIARLDLPPGKQTIQIYNPEIGERNINLNVNSRLQIKHFYYRPDKKIIRKLAYFPGFSQLYKKQYVKGFAFIFGVVGVSSFILHNDSQRKNDILKFEAENNIYKNLSMYPWLNNSQEIIDAGNQAESTLHRIEKRRRHRYIAIGTLVALYAANIFDGVHSVPKHGFSERKKLEFYLSGGQMMSELSAVLKVNLN